jgi:hypothetical protein
VHREPEESIDMYRIDKMCTASTCASLGAAGIYSQSHILEEMGITAI